MVRKEITSSKEYKFISDFYSGKKAKRSGILYMNHINEGLNILEILGASKTAKLAYCLHPIVQGDEFSSFDSSLFDSRVILTVVEYRSVANSYLSHHVGHDTRFAKLSPIEDVNDMLRADKIQNKKDFEEYHLGNHKNSDRLEKYFNEWLDVLGISENQYKVIIKKIS